ncbi:hypothetical protein FF1_017913 [Malus domestica]
MSNLQMSKVLDIGGNPGLVGEIPQSLGSLKNLFWLSLVSNRLSENWSNPIILGKFEHATGAQVAAKPLFGKNSRQVSEAGESGEIEFFKQSSRGENSTSASLSSAASLIEFPATTPRSKLKGKRFTTRIRMSWKRRTSEKVRFGSQIWMRSLFTVPLLEQ